MKFFDLHCDTPYEAYKQGQPFYNGPYAAAPARAETFSRCVQVCAIWLPDECLGARERYSAILNNLKSQISVATTRDGLDRQHSFLLSLEGGAVIESVSDVDALYRDGVRVITLTWNGKNRLAGGVNTFEPLTDLGREVIARMNELSMAVDLSHLNDRSFFEVAPLAHNILATHSCARAVHHVRRNLTDEQIRLIASRGGIVGLCLYPRFLGEGNVFSAFLWHLRHVINVAGIDAVAIGSDFDGAAMDKNLDSIDKIPALWDYLSREGFTDTDLEKIFFSNSYKYFYELLK